MRGVTAGKYAGRGCVCMCVCVCLVSCVFRSELRRAGGLKERLADVCVSGRDRRRIKFCPLFGNACSEHERVRDRGACSSDAEEGIAHLAGLWAKPEQMLMKACFSFRLLRPCNTLSESHGHYRQQ